MKIFFDTSTLIEIERGNNNTIELMEFLSDKNADLIISIITVSEILTGVYLQPQPSKFLLKAKELLGQFHWEDVDGEVAKETAKLVALRIQKGKPVDYQDNLIAATWIVSKSDFLITANQKHYDFETLKGKVYTPINVLRMLKK